jgi:hypothetical protein
MVVTTTNLYSESREVVKKLIKKNVVDPKRGHANSNRRWIYREFPDTTSFTFEGYPIIVLKSADISNQPETLSNCLMDNSFVFAVDVYAEFDDPNSRVDTISDSIINNLFLESNQDTLNTNKLYTPVILGSDTDTAVIDGKKLSYRFMRIDLSGLFSW